MLKAILLEEYRNVVEAYPPGTPTGIPDREKVSKALQSRDRLKASELDGAITLIQRADEGTLMSISDFVNGIEDTTTLADMASQAPAEAVEFFEDLIEMASPSLTAGQLGKLINQYFGS